MLSRHDAKRDVEETGNREWKVSAKHKNQKNEQSKRTKAKIKGNRKYEGLSAYKTLVGMRNMLLRWLDGEAKGEHISIFFFNLLNETGVECLMSRTLDELYGAGILLLLLWA